MVPPVSPVPRRLLAATTTLLLLPLLLLAGMVQAEPQYARCAPVINARGVRDACGHSINPSAVSYLPTSRKLVISGHEYIIHASEGEDGVFTLDGCYYGEGRTLGSGDIEASASLDFALGSMPTIETDPTGRLAINWAKVRLFVSPTSLQQTLSRSRREGAMLTSVLSRSANASACHPVGNAYKR